MEQISLKMVKKVKMRTDGPGETTKTDVQNVWTRRAIVSEV